MNFRTLYRQAQRLYPQSRNYRLQWVRSHMQLVLTGKHLLHGAPSHWGIAGPPTQQAWWPERSWI